MSDEPPVEDGFDYITGFMALHEVVQSGALMVTFAARDITDRAAAKDMLYALAKAPDAPEYLRHYLSMCANMIATWQIAEYKPPYSG